MANRGASGGAVPCICAQQCSRVAPSTMSASADRWSASRSTLSRPLRSCASRRNDCACWKWRKASICRSASPACARSACSSSPRPSVPVGVGQQHAAFEQFVEQQRTPREIVRRPGARGHQLRETRQHRRMLDEQRQVDAASADRFQQREQAAEHDLRLGAGRRCRHRRGTQELRQECVEALARARRQLQVAEPIGARGQALRAARAARRSPRRRARRTARPRARDRARPPPTDRRVDRHRRRTAPRNAARPHRGDAR